MLLSEIRLMLKPHSVTVAEKRTFRSHLNLILDKRRSGIYVLNDKPSFSPIKLHPSTEV